MISIIERPYIRKLSNGLEICCKFLNLITCAVGIAVAYDVEIPSYAFIILGVLNLVAPLSFIILEIIFMIQANRQAKRDKKLGIKPKKMSEQDKQMYQAIDSELNNYSVKKIVEYFTVLGLACFLSLGITTVGIIKSTTNSSVLSSSIPDLIAEEEGIEGITDYEFAGYANWTDFTDNCCCEYKNIFTNGTLNTDVVEIWKCLPNAFSEYYYGDSSTLLYKRKRRVSSSVSGLLLRDYCSPTFNTLAGHTCGEPYYNSTFGRYTVPDCSPNRNMTFEIMKNLW